jgi:hypothetical protein
VLGRIGDRLGDRREALDEILASSFWTWRRPMPFGSGQKLNRSTR